MMPKIDFTKVELRKGSTYPAPYNQEMRGRSQMALGDAGGLSQFGVNLVKLEPSAKSSIRHWHEKQDEFVIITEGELILVDNSGETEMKSGDCATFPAGDPNGHHFVNRTNKPASLLVVGTRTETETGYYSDIDMMVKFDNKGFYFTKKNGTPIKG